MSDADRPRRSDATRATILAAARERFATDGYDRATIRAIAGDAHIDPAMVMRYFGNKERLFAAAADFDLRLPDLAGTPVTEIGDVLVRHFLSRWETDESLTALLRAGTTNEAAADRLRQIFATQILPAVAAVCPDPAQVPLRAGLLGTQILGMALCRYVLRVPPVVAMSPDDIVRWLGPTIGRYLADP
jgi:AcrR family transcriptional regulator